MHPIDSFGKQFEQNIVKAQETAKKLIIKDAREFLEKKYNVILSEDELSILVGLAMYHIYQDNDYINKLLEA